MPNIKIREGRGNIPDTIVKLKAVRRELHDAVIDIVDEVGTSIQRDARRLAPRGNSGKRTGRLRDAIRRDPVKYRPGGAGGVGAQTSRVWVDETMAPQARYVWKGTPESHPGGKIFPRHAGVLAIQKRGEPVHFRMWSHGQMPQRRWWETAQKHGEMEMERRIRELKVP